MVNERVSVWLMKRPRKSSPLGDVSVAPVDQFGLLTPPVKSSMKLRGTAKREDEPARMVRVIMRRVDIAF